MELRHLHPHPHPYPPKTPCPQLPFPTVMGLPLDDIAKPHEVTAPLQDPASFNRKQLPDTYAKPPQAAAVAH